jgi:hypothetical protein
VTDWLGLTRRAAFASHRLVGWIFWDPGAQRNLEALGVPGGMGHYIANRAAPLAAAGTEAVFAAFGTIKREFVEFGINHTAPHATWQQVTDARDAAVLEGLGRMTPEVVEPLGRLADALWHGIDALPAAGRVLFAAHRRWPRPAHPALSAWNAVNTIREWRGDTHFALLATEEIGPVEAGLLHDAWMGYPRQWIPRSRGADDTEIENALDVLTQRGLATDGTVNAVGVAYRQSLEDRTDELCVECWRTVGEKTVTAFLGVIEPVSDRYLAHIDATAGDWWMPAARPRRRAE